MPTLGDRFDDIVNVIDRVRHSGIFCLGAVVVVNFSLFIDSDILQQRIAPDGVINIRFAFLAQFDGLGVATTFEVEHTIVIPTMFIVTN